MQTGSRHERFLRRPNISHLAVCHGNEALDKKVLGNQNNTEVAMTALVKQDTHSA
jgi:hypothetical protein